MPPRRSLLYLAREYPFPLNAASRLRTFNWLLHLSRRFQVTLVAPAFHELSAMESQALDGRCQRLIVVPAAGKPELRRLPQRVLHAVRHLATGMPAEARPLVAGRIEREVRQLLRGQRFDVSFAERWTQVQLATAAAPFAMLDAGELQTTRQVGALQAARNPLRRWWASWGAGMQLRAEIEALRRFHLILLNSALARREVEGYVGEAGTTLVLPEGLNTDHFSPRRRSFNPRRVVFHSSLESFNQQDALHHLREDILPRVRRRFGEIQLTVISARCPAELREQLEADRGVEFLGAVDDPRPVLQSAALAVLPLRLGRGSRSRLIQLLSMGVPTVATPLATAGLDIVSGDGLLLAKGEAAFADAMLQVLEDTSLRRDLAARGRSLAEARLSLHATYGHLTDVLSEASLDLHGTLR